MVRDLKSGKFSSLQFRGIYYGKYYGRRATGEKMETESAEEKMKKSERRKLVESKNGVIEMHISIKRIIKINWEQNY